MEITLRLARFTIAKNFCFIVPLGTTKREIINRMNRVSGFDVLNKTENIGDMGLTLYLFSRECFLIVPDGTTRKEIIERMSSFSLKDRDSTIKNLLRKKVGGGIATNSIRLSAGTSPRDDKIDSDSQKKYSKLWKYFKIFWSIFRVWNFLKN